MILHEVGLKKIATKDRIGTINVSNIRTVDDSVVSVSHFSSVITTECKSTAPRFRTHAPSY